MRTRSLITLLLAAAALAACDTAASRKIAGLNETSGVSGAPALVMSPTRVQMAVGSSSQLSTNAPDTLLVQLEWLSSQPAIAAVTQSGLVTALTPGSSVITVRYATDTTNRTSATIDVSATTPPQ